MAATLSPMPERVNSPILDAVAEVRPESHFRGGPSNLVFFQDVLPVSVSQATSELFSIIVIATLPEHAGRHWTSLVTDVGTSPLKLTLADETPREFVNL